MKARQRVPIEVHHGSPDGYWNPVGDPNYWCAACRPVRSRSSRLGRLNATLRFLSAHFPEWVPNLSSYKMYLVNANAGKRQELPAHPGLLAEPD